jgi:hypothetical protein
MLPQVTGLLWQPPLPPWLSGPLADSTAQGQDCQGLGDTGVGAHGGDVTFTLYSGTFGV